MVGSPQKVLIIRFSSIGDIVLTTPVIRSVKQALPQVELHVLTKRAYGDLLRHHPLVDKVHTLDDSLKTVIRELRSEGFDAVLDLHRNLRSRWVSFRLGRPSAAFPKANLAKLRMAWQQQYPDKWLPHVVERYGHTLQLLGLTLDNDGLDIYYPDSLRPWAQAQLATLPTTPKPLAVVLGAKHTTKRWLPEYFLETLNQLERPVLLLGGKDAMAERDWLLPRLAVPALDAVGQYSLLESTALLDQVAEVLTHDTGFMHIAAALHKRIFSLWGNTVPALGMTPYKTESVILENKGLSCRPCSKIGHDTCPKGHFRCMRDLRPEQVIAAIQAANR